MNNFCVSGRLTAAPEIRALDGEKAVANFSLAINYGYGDNKGVFYVRCSAYNQKLVNVVELYVDKGDAVVVSGPLKAYKYTTKEGEQRQALDMTVNTLDCMFSTKKKED